MDANGTRFQALWGHAGDWKNAVEHVADAEAGGGVLRLKAQTPTFENVSAMDLNPQQRRGAARDRYGNWYWVGPSGREILVRSSGTGAASSFWPVPAAPRSGPFTPAGAPAQPGGRFAGVAVTRHHALVVGTLDPPGLLAFDLAAGGPPRRVAAPPGVQFAPFDLAPLGDGVVVLDRQNRAAWAFDRDLVPRTVTAPNPAPDRFQPVAATSPRRTHDASPAAVALPAGWPSPLAVDGVTCDAAWVLHEAEPDPTRPKVAAKGSPLAKINWSGPKPVTASPALGTREKSTLEIKDQPVAGQNQPVAGHDFAFVSPKRFEVALAGGAQAVAFDIDSEKTTIDANPDFIPLRKFGGMAYAGAAPGAESGSRPAYDSAGKWVPAAAMPRPLFAQSAELVLPGENGWDGKVTDCVWHRVFLDACIPPGCSVRLRAEVRNTAEETWRPATASYLRPGPGATPWQPDPVLRPEGSELPFAPALPTGFGTWETLLHGAKGRYLRLTLALTGDRERSPRVRAVRAWYPRFSYVERYLPAIYCDDADSADYLERFLANAEGTLTGIEDRIAAARSLVDPRTAPAEALDWLTGWLGLAASPGWDARKKRTFLRHAPEILRRRGTIRGLQWALHMELDECVDEAIFADPRTDTSPYRIVETFRRRAAPAVVLGDPTGLDTPRPAPTARTVGWWTPADGPAKLNAAYAKAQGREGQDLPFPLCPPPDDAGYAKWVAFAGDALGFLPVARPDNEADKVRWVEFLRRRYRADNPPGVPLPETLDVRQSVAADWYAFETVVMAAALSAHRFEVLIPTVAGTRVTVSPTPAELEESRDRRNRAWQVVRREAPAHCRFEVRLYASAFRVGGSRVGADTLLGRGSRSPDLYDDAILDASFLGEAFLAARPPLDQPGLTVLGETPTFRARNTLGASPR